MAELRARHLRAAAYYIREEVRRRQRFGIPIPQSLRDLEAALFFASLRDPVQQACQGTSGAAQFETATERARRLGRDTSTVRRHAKRDGGRKVGHQWVFPIDEE